jgi:glycosyltransferase involved in cell wall biosynthesis
VEHVIDHVNDTRRAPRTLFLAHTDVAGGAEFALVRMLLADPAWNAAILLASGDPRDGVFAPLIGRVPIRVRGVRQRAGAANASASAQAGNAARLAVQAAAVRTHPAFRSADLVAANTTRSAAYGALAARTSSVPFVVHIRDLAEPEAIGSTGARIMQRIVLPRADGIVADTARALASAQPFVRAGALTAVIPSASGLKPRAGRVESERPLTVGMLARIDPWKGQELLLDAFAAAFGDGDAVLELAGSAPFGHEDFALHLRARADELGLGDRVRLLGHVEDVDALLARWDVAVQASTRAEPLGQNVLQYLAAGCATVVADEGGPTEWVEHERNGLRFAPRDVAALTAALKRLDAEPELRASLGAAAAATPGLLSDAEVAAAQRDFYSDVVGEVARRRGRGR